MPDSQFNKTRRGYSTRREEFDFSNSMRNFMHNIWLGIKRFYVLIIVFCIVIASCVLLYGRLSYTPRYEASVTFLAEPLMTNNSNNLSDIFRYNNNIILGSQLSTTFPYIFESGILKEIVQSEMGTDFDADITATSVANTNYFKITVISDTPENAKNIADCLMENYPKVSENILGEIRTEIKIPSKLPTAPCNQSNYLIWTFYALAISIIFCLFCLCVYVANRKTVCSKDDIKYVLNQPYLCEVPFVKEKDNSKNRFKSIIRSKSFLESIRTLKNRTISTIAENNYQTIGIVSTTNDEGKSTIGAGFARILSSQTESAIFVTFDHAVASHTDGIFKRKDTSTVVLMEKEATDKISAPVEGIKKLFANVDLLVLPSKIISDKKIIAELFETLKENYKYVIIDIVPGDSHSESVSLINFCDAYISVIRCDYISINKVKNTLKYFSYSTSHNLGVVLNGVSSTYISYGRYSNYDKYRKYSYGYNYNYYSYGQYGEDSNDELT